MKKEDECKAYMIIWIFQYEHDTKQEYIPFHWLRSFFKLQVNFMGYDKIKYTKDYWNVVFLSHNFKGLQ